MESDIYLILLFCFTIIRKPASPHKKSARQIRSCAFFNLGWVNGLMHAACLDIFKTALIGDFGVAHFLHSLLGYARTAAAATIQVHGGIFVGHDFVHALQKFL